MQNYQSITLDVNNCIEYRYINAKQGDINSRFLKITLTENGKKIIPPNRCRASFRCLKPDSRICINNATINSDSTITATLTEQVLASAGTVRADISLLDGKTVLSSATFFITVEASPASEGNILSSDEFLILVKTTNDAISAINSLDDVFDKTINSIEDVKAYIGYSDNDILGLSVDYENKKFTRLAGAVDLNAGADFDRFNMYGGRKRCNVYNNGDIVAYYGDLNYSDTNNGQVMVYQPKFYYKVVPIKLEKITDGIGYHIRKANYYVTDKPLAGFKLHPAFYDDNGNEIDYILLSAYEGVLYNNIPKTFFDDGTMDDTDTTIKNYSIRSIANQKPISGLHKNLTRANFELISQNRGHGWHLETIKTLSANQLLMMIELGSMNVQNAAGKGVVTIPSNATYNASSLTGSTASLGNATGSASKTINETGGVKTAYTENGKVAVSYRGVENPWGNLYKFINGINIWGDGAMSGGQPYIADNLDFAENKKDENYQPAGFTLPSGAGYISAMGYGSEKYDWLLMASELNGNNSLPVGDYTETTADLNGCRNVLYGGANYNNLAAGLFDFYCAASTTAKGRTFGGRLVFIPTAE